MAFGWWSSGRRAPAGASTPTVSSYVVEFLQLSRTNIEKINYLTSREFQVEPLNLHQCRSISSKLLRTLKNIETLAAYSWNGVPPSNTSPLSAVGSVNFYLVSERAKELVESCCSVNWCQASTFQIHNEEAFKEILLETSLCYNAVYDDVEDKVRYEDLRQTSTFEPPTSGDIMHDRMELLQRYEIFVNSIYTSDSDIRKQYLAKHLLRRLKYTISQSNIKDFDLGTVSSWRAEWGHGSVFLGGCVCKTTWLDVPCAKKVFKDGVEGKEILAEARILASLNHPNIVKFICWGHDKEDSWHFIAMELMERGLDSLIKKQARLRQGAPFPLLSAVDIMLQVANGTCYLHDNGVAHRDLKTCNVVVRQITTPHLQDYFQVKLVDFGLSKMRLRASRSNTISYPKIGTTVYMPPEAFQHGRANWFKADAYSFGIMCSVILSGEEPFQEIPRNHVQTAVCSGERPMLPRGTPEELVLLIQECWHTDRRLRPTFVDICTRLTRLRHKLLRSTRYNLEAEVENVASSYIQDVIEKRSGARKQNGFQSGIFQSVIEEDERSIPNQTKTLLLPSDVHSEHQTIDVEEDSIIKVVCDYKFKSSVYVHMEGAELSNLANMDISCTCPSDSDGQKQSDTFSEHS